MSKLQLFDFVVDRCTACCRTCCMLQTCCDLLYNTTSCARIHSKIEYSAFNKCGASMDSTSKPPPLAKISPGG